MPNESELIHKARTIHIFPVEFKRLFENPLVEKNFDISKVDILRLKESEIEKRIKDHIGWFKEEGADKYSDDVKKKFLVFALVVQKVMDVRITYSPETSLYFIESNGALVVKNKWVYSNLYSGSLIYKDSSPFSIPDLEFVIRQREIHNVEVLTGYFRSHDEDKADVLFDFPIELASAKIIAKKFKFELKEFSDFAGKGDLDELYFIIQNQFKSEGMEVDEYIELP